MNTILLPYARKSNRYEKYALHGIHSDSYQGEFGDVPLSLIIMEEKDSSGLRYDNISFDKFKSLNIKHVYLRDMSKFRNNDTAQRLIMNLPDSVTDLSIKPIGCLFVKCDIYAKSLKRLNFVEGYGFVPTSYKNGWLGCNDNRSYEEPPIKIQVDPENLEELHIGAMKERLKVGNILKGFKNLRSVHIPYNMIESLDDIPTDNLEELYLVFGEMGSEKHSRVLMKQCNTKDINEILAINRQLCQLKKLKSLKYTVIDEYDDLSELPNLEELHFDLRYIHDTSTDIPITDNIKGLKLKGLCCSVFNRDVVDELIREQPNLQYLELHIGYEEENLDLTALTRLKDLTIYMRESCCIPKGIKSNSLEIMRVYCYDEAREPITPFKSAHLPRLKAVEINGIKESRVLDLFRNIHTIKSLSFLEDPLGYNYYVETFQDAWHDWVNNLEHLEIQFNEKIYKEVVWMEKLQRLTLRHANKDMMENVMESGAPLKICYTNNSFY